MPRIATYQPGQVGPVETTSARFRAPDVSRSGLAEGLQGFGQAVGQYADAKDRLLALSEETQARSAALDARAKLNESLTQYGTLQGGNAIDAQAKTLDQLKTIKDGAAQGLGTPRMKAFFDRNFEESYADAVNRVNGHAIQQVQVQRVGTVQAEAQSFADQAISEWQNIDAREKAMAQGTAALVELGKLQGQSDAEIALNQKKYVSGIHRNTVDQFLASADPDYEAAADYFNAHHDDMLAADRESVMKDLQGPMQARLADSDVQRSWGGGIVAKVGGEKQAGQPTIARMVGITAASESGNKERTAGGQLVTSPKGAQGAMQVMPGTQRDPGFGITPMRDNSDAERTRVGQEYIAKMMERYNGDPAKAWAAYNWGPGNVDKAIQQNGANWLASAPAETRSYVAKNMAQLDGSGHSTESPQEWDKDAAYNKIDTLADKEGWTFERRERAKRRADQIIARDEDLLNRQYRQAGQDAVQVIVGLGDNFTDVSQIPSAIRDRADPVDLAKWKEAADKNKIAKSQIPKDGVRSVELQIMARSNPNGFLGVDLSKEVGKVAPEELKWFALKQAELIGQRDRPRADNHRSTIVGAINWAKKYGGLDISDKDFPAVYDAAEAYLQAKGVSVATEKDGEEAVRNATRDIPVQKSFFGFTTQGTIKAYEVTRVDQIPAATLDYINASLAKVPGNKPDDKQRLEMYRRLIAGRNFN